MLATLVVALPKWQKQQQQQLAVRRLRQIESLEPREAATALRQLAALGDDALEALMLAAASEQVHIAIEAREILDLRIANWKVRVQENSEFFLAEPLRQVALALATHVESLGPVGQEWATSLALEIVELSQHLATSEAISIIANCSAVLDVIPAAGPRARDVFVDTRFLENNPLPYRGLDLPSIRPERSTAESNDRSSIESQDLEGEYDFPREPEQEIIATRLPASTDWGPRWSRQPTTSVEPTRDEPMVVSSNMPAPVAASEDIPSPESMVEELERLRLLNMDELSEQLAGADRYTAALIGEVLRERGMTSSQLELMSHLKSADASVRLQLIDNIQQLPARVARHWLRQLLRDNDAEVRLKALTVLATTDDPELTNIAREMAVHDENPRVAELAAQIVRRVR